MVSMTKRLMSCFLFMMAVVVPVMPNPETDYSGLLAGKFARQHFDLSTAFECKALQMRLEQHLIGPGPPASRQPVRPVRGLRLAGNGDTFSTAFDLPAQQIEVTARLPMGRLNAGETDLRADRFNDTFLPC